MNVATTSTYNDYKHYFWVVDVTELRGAEGIDHAQMQGVVKIWLNIVAPNAEIIESPKCDKKFAVFARRDDQRKFLRTFGGRKLTNLPPGLPV